MGSSKQDFREALAWLRAHGWRVDEERGGYPMAYCPCGAHRRTVHYSPSNPRYFNQLRAWVRRQDCWEVER